MKIPNEITPQTNNFDFLRLFGAFLVFFGHAILITHPNGFFNWDRGLSIGAAGVNIFFIISGFLITKSWLDNENFLLFIKKRCLRIYPALIATGLFTILAIGPLVTFFSPSNYFENTATLKYLLDIILLKIWDIKTNILPGVFVTNNLPLVVNASLWTIPIEVGLYLMIALLGLKTLFKKRLVFLYALVFLLIYAVIISINNDFSLSSSGDSRFPLSDAIRLLTYFTSGIVLYLYKGSIKIPRRYSTLLLLVILITIIAGKFELTSYFVLPLFIIFIAFEKIDFAKKLTSYGDFSYGVYLFGFPIQQTVSFFSNNSLSFFEHLLISLALTLALAVLSWNFIEKPFLRMKNYPFAKHTKK